MVLVVLSVIFTTVHSTGLETALQFGANNNSYVLLMPDLTPARDEVTVCSWVKRMSNHRDSWQFWLSFATRKNAYELNLSDVGNLYFLQDLTYNTLPNETLTTIDEWHHICATWGFSNHTTFIYFDGELAGTKSTWPDRKLRNPGSLMLGQFHSGYGGGKIEENGYFGGQLYDLNIYSKQLTGVQIKDMFDQNRCSSNMNMQTFGKERIIQWKEILKEEKHGNVTEVLLDCASGWDVLYKDEFYNKEISENLIEDLETLKDLLQEFEGYKIDRKLIEHMKKHHDV